MQAVLISIRPEWCSKIVNGEKTIEVRKTKPKLEPPFKCYIYMTKGFASYAVANEMWAHNNGGMCVIGEFICDRIFPIYVFENGAIQNWNYENMGDSCVPYDEVESYVGYGKTGYGWHISDLKVYGRPKELSEFRAYCKEYDKAHPRCGRCEYYYYECNECVGFYDECSCDGMKHITRAPQSWCYVEEANDG